jgi:DeoR/GlpR family transcriptional regulator of sugar metabolism
MSVMLDDSTTTLELAKLLKNVTPLTVITNFVPIIRLAVEMRDTSLIALGGEYHRLHESFLGVGCVEAIRALHADIVFVSTSAVRRGAAYHQEEEIVWVKRAMIGAAERRVLLVDHTKLERVALHHVAPLADLTCIVTDAAAAPASLTELRESHPNVQVAPTT